MYFLRQKKPSQYLVEPKDSDVPEVQSLLLTLPNLPPLVTDSVS